MKYSRFEMLAFALGTAAIVGSAFVPATAQVIPAEFAAQLLMIIILAGALHWGRNGGFITALIAIAIYVGMRYDVLVSEGLSVDMITMIVSRAVAYTVIGLAGGELAGRIKYVLTRVERETMIDPVTRVYSTRYAGRAIASAIGQFRRYQTPCSIVLLTVSPKLWSDLKPSRMNSLMRKVASYIRNDVRLVDDVAYRGNGGFIVILPSTGAEGAAVATERLRRGVVSAIDSEDTAIAARILTCGIDDEALDELATALAPAPDPEDVEPNAPQQTDRRATDRQPDGA